MMEFSTERC